MSTQPTGEFGVGCTALLGRMRLLAVDHQPDGWPAVRMSDVTALCDELERIARNRDMWKAQVTRQAEQIATLRDWLADKGNSIGNVQLLTACAEANLTSLRGAIDGGHLVCVALPTCCEDAPAVSPGELVSG